MVKVTVNNPGPEYSFEGSLHIGLVDPSPKSQEQVSNSPVDVLVKSTFNGATPEVGVPVKSEANRFIYCDVIYFGL